MQSITSKLALTVGTTLFGVASWSQETAVTEVHDAVRGVTFYSVQLSEEAVDEWELISGEFAETDRVRLGLSALVLDEVESVEEYIFWVRHEGRRWLSFFDVEDSVTFVTDGQRVELEPLRRPQPFVQIGALVEKLEFKLGADDLRALLENRNATLTVKTATGVIEKELNLEELTSMALLRDRVS